MSERYLEAGTIVAERYKIVRKLGEGGMGAVYQATQLNLRRDVALKLILPEHAAAEGARGRFEREARVASALRHPNAVDIYDFGEHENTLFIAMQMLNGASLRATVDIDKPPLDLTHAIKIGTQVADVLVAAAQIPLVHRDLKPENIILDRGPDGDERVVVVDFGLAFMTEREGDMGRLTREGVVTGTPDYMSPEQARGTKLSPAGDIYSLACVMHEMLTTVPPFEGDAAILLSRHLFVAPTPIREAFPKIEVPGVLDDLIMRMLAKAPEERPTARSVRDTLMSIDVSAPSRMSGVESDGHLLGRAGRMVSKAPVNTHGKTEERPQDLPPMSTQVKLAVFGEVDETFSLALAANGFTCVMCESLEDANGLQGIFAQNRSTAELAELMKLGMPVVADAQKSDMNRLQALLQVGVAEVVIQPASADDVARKLWRAIRKSSKRK